MRKPLVAVALVAMATILLAGTTTVADQPPPPPPTDFPPGESIIGIYTANDGTGYAHTSADAFQQIIVYLVLSGIPDNDNVLGWELFIDLGFPPAGWFVLQYALQGDALNVKTAPEFAVGIDPPLTPIGGAVTLLEMTILTGSTDTVLMGLDILQTAPPSLPGEIVYAKGDPGNLVPMTPSSGSFAFDVFGINLPLGEVMPHEVRGAIPNETATWGGVKNLYK